MFVHITNTLSTPALTQCDKSQGQLVQVVSIQFLNEFWSL